MRRANSGIGRGKCLGLRKGRGLQSCSIGEVDAEPVASTLIAPGHLSRGVTKLLLDVSLLDLGRRSEASAQRVTGEL